MIDSGELGRPQRLRDAPRLLRQHWRQWITALLVTAMLYWVGHGG